MTRIHTSILAFVLVILCLFVPLTNADIVTLKDGTVYEGTVTEENSAQVVIEIVISNIKTSKTFPKYKVRSVEYKPLPEQETKEEEQVETSREIPVDLPAEVDSDEEEIEEEDDDRSSARDRLEARRNRVLFVEIPIRGLIGMETNARGLKNALSQASKRGVQHVVFTIDSPGGYLYDAIAALEVLKDYDDTFEYHAMVDEGAISAASIYVAAADHIWVRPGARVGGAVAYSENTSSGAAEVDAKLNSIWAADIAARAQTKGHPPEVFRAMVEPAAELWIDAEGKAYPSRPGTPGASQLDNTTTVLTIRADQMVQIGMAKEFAGDIEDLGEVLEIENGWFEVRTIGIRAMERAHEERQKLHDRYEEAVKVFLDAAEDFKQDHPENHNDYNYYIDRYGRSAIEGFSFQRWRERANKTIGHCDIMLQALGRMASVNKSASSIGAVHLEYLPNEYGDEAYKEIQEARARLVSIKDKPPER
jgi:hypothetical protein